jgi:MFS family permease
VTETAGPYKNEDTKISKKINLSDVKEFPVRSANPNLANPRRPLTLARTQALYWVLAVCIALFYSIVFPFMANAPTYLEEEKFGLSSTGLRVSSVYGVSMVASVALGAFVDWFGRRTQIAIIGTGLTIPTFYLLGYTTVDPIVSMLMLGVSYSVCAAALWPSVQMLVPLRTSGTANGVATSVQMLGIGICNIVVGKLNDGATFSHQMLFFAGLGAASLATALSMFCADTDRKMYLGKRDEDLSETDEMRSPLITKEELV